MSENNQIGVPEDNPKDEAGEYIPEVTPEEYSAFVSQIELQSIWLKESRVSNNHGPVTPEQATLRFEADADWEAQDDGFRATSRYRVLAETSDELLAEIGVTFGLDFASAQPMNNDIFAVFAEVNLPVNTWPYLREFVSTSMGRMGWIPFTIPAFKTNVNRSRTSANRDVEADLGRDESRPGDSASPSDRGEAYLTFWRSLLDELRDRHGLTRKRTGHTRSWINFGSGVSGIIYGVCFDQRGRVRTEVYFNLENVPMNKARFDALAATKAEIEAALGEPLVWTRMDDRKASRIAIYRPGSIEDSAQSLEEIKDWAIEHFLRFKKVFGLRIIRLRDDLQQRHV